MNLKKYSWLAALPMIFTACQEDMLVENTPDQGITTLTASMDSGSDSRAQIVLNGTNSFKELFHWNEEDQFTLFELANENNEWTEHVFGISDTYSDNNPGSQADFSTSSALTPGSEFVAFYPACTPDAKGGIQLSIDNKLATNNAASWKSYFMNNLFMKTRVSTVGQTSADTQVNFEQLCGIIRIKYTNASKTDRTFDRIGVNGNWTTGRYYTVSDAESFVDKNSSRGWLGVEFENKATVKAGETQNFYILYFSNGADGVVKLMSQVIVDVDLTNKETTLYSPSKELPQFKAGQCYWLNITDNGKELFWTKDQEQEVSSVSELEAAILNDKVKNIILTAPIEVSNLNLNFKTLTLSPEIFEGFTADAAITVVSDEEAQICDGIIVGDIDDDAKFIIKSTAPHLGILNATIEAKGGMNAVYVEDSEFILNQWAYPSKIIPTTVKSTDGYALYLVAETSPVFANIYGGTTIDGAIHYYNNKYDCEISDKGMSYLGINGTVNGNLTVDGQYQDDLNIRIGDNAQIGENCSGWPNIKVKAYNYEQLLGYLDFSNPDNETIKEITLMDQIVIDTNDPLGLSFGDKIIKVDDSVWADHDAAILVRTTIQTDEYNHFYIMFNGVDNPEYRGVISGTTTLPGKYLIKSTSVGVGFNGTTLQANGTLNAVCVENAPCYLSLNSIITSENGYALDMIANPTAVQVDVNNNSQINGVVRFLLNNYQPVQYHEGNHIGVVDDSSVQAVVVEGKLVDELSVNTERGGTIGSIKQGGSGVNVSPFYKQEWE